MDTIFNRLLMLKSINDFQKKALFLFFLIKETLKFYWKAKTVHDIDSPLVFDLVHKSLETKIRHPKIQQLLEYKKKCEQSKLSFRRTDFGQGSKNHINTLLQLGPWIKSSSIDAYYGSILYRLADRWQPAHILELGTAAGFSASYMGIGAPSSQVITLEGDPFLVGLASKTFESVGLKNIQLMEGPFDLSLPKLSETWDMVNIDGNHNKKAILTYLEMIKHQLAAVHVLIIDDIRWSSDMFTCWKELKSGDTYNVQLDFYRMGVLIKTDAVKHKIELCLLPARWKPMRLGLVR